MSFQPRIFPADRDLGKRDDDRKPSKHQSWQWMTALRLRRRRLLMGVLGAFLVWLFIHNIPTDLGSVDERMGHSLRPGHSVGGVPFGYRPPGKAGKAGSAAEAAPRGASRNTSPNKEPTGPPPRSETDATVQDRYYSGPVKFYKLAKTLQGISRTLGHRTDNSNILFAAASLKSAANLLPMACEMARVDKNYVHFALLGREAVPLNDVLEINGIDRASCDIFFHDARSDYSEYSTDTRAQVSVKGALSHIHAYMHPQAIITDDPSVEDPPFVKAMRAKSKELKTPVIEIPEGKYEDFLWMTRLDSGGLTSWHKPDVSILIHAQSESTGSLLRLLHSLETADYAGLPLPDITVDVPADIETFARNYLRDFEWPPHQDPSGPYQRRLRVHHRISTAKITTESNALRFLESWYPVNSDFSHVLLLSAQTELSPLYYHYVMYNMLLHRYSAFGSDDADNLFGLALATPSAYLNGSSPFQVPTSADTGKKMKASEEPPVPFLWQAPNADAILIFGDVWAEVHDFLKNRLRAAHDTSNVQQPPKRPGKLVSEAQPGWLEYMLELMRARGWRTLYPAPQEAGAWATIHKDLYQKPEEFINPPKPHKDKMEKGSEGPTADEGEPFLRAEPAAEQIHRPEKYSDQNERQMVQHSQPLHTLLSFEGAIGDLPLLEYSGQAVDRQEIQDLAKEYRPILRQQVGGCNTASASHDPNQVLGKTKDLFCFLDQLMEIEPQDADLKTAKAIAESEVSEPVSYAVTDVKAPDRTSTKEATKNVIDSAARQKLAHMRVEQPAVGKEVVKDDVTLKKEVVKDDVAPKEKVVKDDVVPKKEALLPPVVPEKKPVKIGAGTMKPVVEDLGPPKPKTVAAA